MAKRKKPIRTATIPYSDLAFKNFLGIPEDWDITDLRYDPSHQIVKLQVSGQSVPTDGRAGAELSVKANLEGGEIIGFTYRQAENGSAKQ